MSPTEPPLSRVLITIRGCVQGVGFRPFIYRLAHAHQLVGSISNTCTGVAIDVQGAADTVSKFQHAIARQKPERAAIAELIVQPAPLSNASAFAIMPSESGADKALALLPDTAMCPACQAELFDPSNRRYHYPFLHCIACGPRFSLFLRMPFDRDHTTMRHFHMCTECQREYAEPTDRRFYSQTNCCPQCGPRLQLLDANGREIAGPKDALTAAAHYLQQGKIVAMKNTGGYLLLVDATNETAVQRLRQRKRRPSKPFALLMPHLASAEEIAHVGTLETSLLTSPAAPIVLLAKRKHIQPIAPAVACGSPYYGIMLPHNALQHLLMERVTKPLVATSGNSSGWPLCITEQEALASLSDIADAFLVHDRLINHRLDDSIVHVMAGQPVIIRKARGYIPCAITVPPHMQGATTGAEHVFAAGSQMKNSFAFLLQGRIYMGQHIGDLDSVAHCQAYDSEVASWKALLALEAVKGVGDKHPTYYSSQYLERENIAASYVQHHHAHVWAAMADNKLAPPFLGISWDGTGWGDDATVWGGEAFRVTDRAIQRVASLYPFPLPGGEKAVREPRRALLGLLYAMGRDGVPPPYAACLGDFFSESELAVLTAACQKGINAPICSSIGRLFDAVSALLDLCAVCDFEGQAALLLEAAAHQAAGAASSTYAPPLIKDKGLLLLDWRPMIKEIVGDRRKGVPVPTIALAFHEALADGMVALARSAGMPAVLLTGGVMQNKLLVEKAVVRLTAAGFTPYLHRDIPPNDGGIAVGQLLGHCIEPRRDEIACI